MVWLFLYIFAKIFHMIEILKNPPKDTWVSILRRPAMDNSSLESKVKSILDDIRVNGDEAALKYTNTFDNPNQRDFEIPGGIIAGSEKNINPTLKVAIDNAAKNIETFHLSQREESKVVETQPGVSCWRKNVGIEKVGLYIPGGTAPLFSTILMLAIPAKIAGCKEIVLCTPEGKNGIHPAILYAAKIAGVNKVFRIGGAQAIASMAYGTESIPKVYKIFGPGNQFVTMAKMLVSMQGTAIDMPAGPSEVMIVADETANPEFIAADMLSQCEHGADSQAVLLTNSSEIAEAAAKEIDKQLNELSRKELASQSLQYSKIIVLDNDDNIVALMNEYAAEHLILSVKNPMEFGNKVVNAGSVFLGHYSPESVGDYASGTNHTLPTNGFAKAYSGVSLDSFIKKITFQELSTDGLSKLGPLVETMASAEQLDAHKNAVTVRLNSLK